MVVVVHLRRETQLGFSHPEKLKQMNLLKVCPLVATVVERSTHKPKIGASITATGTEKDKMTKMYIC